MSLSSTIAPTDDDAAIPCPIPEPNPAKPMEAPTPIATIPALVDNPFPPPSNPENTNNNIAIKNP